MKLRLILIGCSKSKHAVTYDRRRGGRVLPTELYAGQLFPRRVAYAERIGAPWAVLSAEYGLWRPDVEMRPYETTFADLSPADRAVWHICVSHAVAHYLWEPWEEDERNPVLRPRDLTVEIHAGRDYAHPLAENLRAVGIRVELPCEGLGIGKQLAWYDRIAREATRPAGDASGGPGRRPADAPCCVAP